MGASMCVPVCSAYVRSLANTYMPPPTDILRSGVLVKVVSAMLHHGCYIHNLLYKLMANLSTISYSEIKHRNEKDLAAAGFKPTAL